MYILDFSVKRETVAALSAHSDPYLPAFAITYLILNMCTLITWAFLYTYTKSKYANVGVL